MIEEICGQFPKLSAILYSRQQVHEHLLFYFKSFSIPYSEVFFFGASYSKENNETIKLSCKTLEHNVMQVNADGSSRREMCWQL